MLKLSPGRAWALDAARRYWPNGVDAVAALAIPEIAPSVTEPLPPRLVCVPLPEWAADLGVKGGLLAPRQMLPSADEPDSLAVDWIGVMQWFLHGTAERAHEARYGPIHSYRVRLKGWPDELWDHAWVNRIALFLRRWCARQLDRTEQELFGSLPRAEVILTHDVDAIRKTTMIRFKQSAFHAFNALRRLAHGRPARAALKARDAIRFLISHADYWCFERLTALESGRGVRSTINVYAGPSGLCRSGRSLLIDPGYSPEDAMLVSCLHDLRRQGWTIGLHPSFEAWNDASAMRRERERLERAVLAPVTSCRQHWLRFAWSESWRAQAAAGLQLDTTLGFNDRPGFRNSAALRVRPWDPAAGRPLAIDSLPMVLMDSHFYDYGDLAPADVPSAMEHWMREIAFVGGEATVLWHPHGLSQDYGWAAGFESLLDLCRRYATAGS